MRAWRSRRRDEASCAEVARVLQRYLDGWVDDLTAQRVRRHLESCRRCGLEAATYQAIKDAVARRGRDVDSEAVRRLREFGDELASEGPTEDEAAPPGDGPA